jgi:hypothetical protein
MKTSFEETCCNDLDTTRLEQYKTTIGSSAHGNKHSGSIRDEGFLD